MSRVRIASVIAVVAGTVALVLWQRDEAERALLALRGARPVWLALGVLALVGWCLAWAGTYAGPRSAIGLPSAKRADLVRTTLMAITANNIVTAGGLAGLSAFDRLARRKQLSVAKTHGAYVISTVLVDLAFLVTLIAGGIALVVDHRLDRTETWAAALVIGLFAAKTLLVLVAAGNRDHLRRLYALPNVVRQRIRGTQNASANGPATVDDHASADELYEAFFVIRRQPRRLLPAVAAAVAIDAFGVLMLMSAIAAVGGGVSVVTALVVYVVSSLFAIVSVIPGGLGAVEIGAVAVLIGFGIPAGTAAAAVLVFRVLEFWLPVSFGALASLRFKESV